MKSLFGYYEDRLALIICAVLTGIKVLASVFFPFYGFVSCWLLTLLLIPEGSLSLHQTALLVLIVGIVVALVLVVLLVLLVFNRRVSAFASITLLITGIGDILAALLIKLADGTIPRYDTLPLLFHIACLIPLIFLLRSKNDFYL